MSLKQSKQIRCWLSARLAVASIAFALIFISSCGNTEKPVRLGGDIFGTTYSLIIAGPVKDSGKLNTSVKQQLDSIDQSMSSWKEDSELNTFLRQPVGNWVTLSQDLIRVLEHSQQIHKLTDGAFDPSLGPLIKLWGFQGKQRTSPPLPQQIEQVLNSLGFAALEIKGRQARRTRDIDINLSAIAKGYAVDKVANLLRAMGYKNFLVEIGGELVTSGSKYGNPWIVGIEAPQKNSRDIQQKIRLGDAAIATSGSYRSYFESGNKHYQHILDPESGYPSDNRVVSVSVLANDCATADAYATAFMVMGEKAISKAEELGIETMMLIETENGLQTLVTKGMSNLLED